MALAVIWCASASSHCMRCLYWSSTIHRSMQLTTTQCHIGSIWAFIRQTKKSPIHRSFRASNCRRCARKRLPRSTIPKINQSTNSTLMHIKANTFTTHCSITMHTMRKFLLCPRCTELGEIRAFFFRQTFRCQFSIFAISVHCKEILVRKRRQCLVSICSVQQVVHANWKV